MLAEIGWEISYSRNPRDEVGQCILIHELVVTTYTSICGKRKSDSDQEQQIFGHAAFS